MSQGAINLNVQERLRAAEAVQYIMGAYLFALAETHPEPERLRQQFVLRSEQMLASLLASGLAEDGVDAATAFRERLLSAFRGKS